MRTIPYSAAKSDLFTPWLRDDYFGQGEARGTASLAAELSRLAYCRKPPSRSFDSDKVQSVLAKIGFSDCKFFESPGRSSKGGTHCFAAIGTDQGSGRRLGVVSFRGTDSDDPTDLGDDVDFLLIPWQAGGKVHQGFANALAEVRPVLDPAVKAMGLPILFTGHSLGAALATVAASAYRSAVAGSALYTFGSPRVGNAAFAATFDGMDVQRYVDCCDLVTRVPPAEMDYAHVAQPHYIDRNGLITFDPNQSLIAHDRVAAEADYLLHYAWKVGNVGVRALADHAPINYVRAVAAANKP
jgi:hypothetical protein